MADMVQTVPFVGGADSTLALLHDGYRFMASRRREAGGRSFRCRLMGREVLCIVGREAAELFYGSGRFTRRGAMPPTTLRLLQDKGSVQLLDGLAHAHRKALFRRLTEEDALERFGQCFERAWSEEEPHWRQAGAAPLLGRMQRILCQAGADWAGVPLAGA
ncbi:MAG: cytochrome P450, partial [Alphaproteobacteria bacterium]|nr:cytochrome P450 [Alphaproteobacteria bacterium]